MQRDERNGTVNPAGSPKIAITNTASRERFKREDFVRDLKKVVRKLPPDHPSRSDPRKR